MSRSDNSGEGFKVFIFLGVMIFLIMYLFDLGPFEKRYSSPSPAYYNYGGGRQPSFTGNKYDCERCFCPRYEEMSPFNSDCKNCKDPKGWHYSQK